MCEAHLPGALTGTPAAGTRQPAPPRRDHTSSQLPGALPSSGSSARPSVEGCPLVLGRESVLIPALPSSFFLPHLHFMKIALSLSFYPEAKPREKS